VPYPKSNKFRVKLNKVMASGGMDLYKGQTRQAWGNNIERPSRKAPKMISTSILDLNIDIYQPSNPRQESGDKHVQG